MPSGAVLEGRGRPLQPKSAGLPGITRQRVGLPLKIFRLNSLLLLPPWASGSPTGFFSLTMANLWRHPTGYVRASLGRSFISND